MPGVGQELCKAGLDRPARSRSRGRTRSVYWQGCDGVRRIASMQEYAHAAFISYSHAADEDLAPALEAAVERFPRLWYQPRPRRVFLDRGDLTPSTSLPNVIESALRGSKRLVLLASPQAAASWWVTRELRWWSDNRSLDDLVLVLTAGEIVWDRSSGRLNPVATTALPDFLIARLTSDPLYVDLRPVRAISPNADDPQWQHPLAEIVAAIDDVPKDSLIGEHVRNRRRRRRLVTVLIAVLSLLVVAASGAAWIAFLQRNRAVEQARIATARQLASTSDALRGSRIDLALALSCRGI